MEPLMDTVSAFSQPKRPETLKELIQNAMANEQDRAVNNPPHYLQHPSGVECIQITEHMNFCLGNAIKYIWRAGLKADNPVQDLEKAVWYLKREIARRTKA